MAQHAEGIEQPNDDHGDNDEVEDAFDRPLHGDVGVDEPEHHADDDQSEDNGEE